MVLVVVVAVAAAVAAAAVVRVVIVVVVVVVVAVVVDLKCSWYKSQMQVRIPETPKTMYLSYRHW